MTGRLYTKKSIERLVADSEQPWFRLNRFLGRWELIAIGLGATIGSGIYILPGVSSMGVLGGPPSGPSMAFAFLLPALVCLLIGFCYAELACMMPLAGSLYTYAYAAFGELAAWIAGWILVLEYAVANVVVAGAAAYLLKIRLAGFGWVLPERWSSTPFSAGGWAGAYFNLPAFLLIIMMTAVSAGSVRLMSRANALLVLLKGGAIVLFLALGGALVRPANWHPFAPGGFSGAISVGVAVVFAFVGFDAVSLAAEEARDPERDLPAGILGSIGISTAAYVSVTLVVLGIIPYTAFHSAPWGRSGAAAYALKAVGAGPLVQAAVTAGMLIGMFSLMLVLQYGQSRIWYAMARDRLLPPVFASLHPESHAPRRCAWISGAALAVTAGLVTIGDSGDLAAFGALAAFAIAPICVIALRRSQPERVRSFKAPWSPWLPLVALAGVLVPMLTLPRLVWVRFAIWLVIGLAIYFGYGMRKSATPHRCA